MQELQSFRGRIPKIDLEHILDNLPSSLDVYYDRILSKIPERRQRKLHAVLKWLLFSTQTLYVEEVVDACIINLREDVYFDKNDRLDPEDIVADLSGLVKIVPSWSTFGEPIPQQTHTLALSHFSVHEYLISLKNRTRPSTRSLPLSLRVESVAAAHREMMLSCFAYLLTCKALADGMTRDYPLRPYAWRNWAHHLIAAQSKEQGPNDQTILESFRMFNTIVHSFTYQGHSETPAKDLVVDWSDVNELLLWLYHWSMSLVVILVGGQLFESNIGPSSPSKALARFLSSIRERTTWFSARQDTVWSTYVGSVAYLQRDQQRDLLNILRDTAFPNDSCFRDFEIGEEDDTSFYKLLPLSYAPLTFRLLILHASEDPESPLRCSLAVDCFENYPEYTALSYTWGAHGQEKNIFVDGHGFSVRDNLFWALYQLRRKSKARVLWIDALCISMQDLDERSSQILQMPKIYRSASDNVVWAGQATLDTQQGIALLRKSETSVPYGHCFRALDDILGRALWNRSWLIQEVVVARNLTILCGSSQIPWRDVRNVKQIQTEMEQDLTDSKPLALGGDTQSWTGFAILQYLRTRIREEDEITLPELLYLSRHHLATDLRDKVFAVLSLLPDAIRADPLLQPDYSTPIAESFTRVAVYILQRYQRLDLFSCVYLYDEGRPHYNVGAPSWVPLWHDYHHDPLAPGMFLPARPRLFSAGGESCPKPLIFSNDLRKVTCQGVIVDEAGFQYGTAVWANDQMPSEDWHGALRPDTEVATAIARRYPSLSERREAYWRTAVADTRRLPDGTKSRLPSTPIFSAIGDNYGAAFQVPPDSGALPLQFFVAKKGYMGRIIGSRLRYGDVIAILLGGQVPFVLRPLELNKSLGTIRTLSAWRRRSTRTNDWGAFTLVGEW